MMESDSVAMNMSEQDALAVLQSSEIIGGHRIPWGSNNTFMVRIDTGSQGYLRVIYKPRDGESPLADFPMGSLYKREYAAYVLSCALGWPRVPLTLIRNGPYGVGSVQLFIEADPRISYFELIEEHEDEMLRFAVFDVIANNADRKGGHCLLGRDGGIWSIDHGLTFHPVFKMRTVMLELWGAPIPEPLLRDIEALPQRLKSESELAGNMEAVLTPKELAAVDSRVEVLLKDPVIPRLNPRFNVPWPLV